MNTTESNWEVFVRETENIGDDPYSNSQSDVDILIKEDERALEDHGRSNKSWYKRVSLLIPITFAVCMYFYNDVLFDIKYISPATFICSFIVFWNFPKLGAWLQTKPTYVEDLVIDVNSKDIKYRFVKRYTLVTNFFLSGLVMFIIDYTIFQKYNTSNLHSFEMIGIIGGVISIYFKVQAIVGKLLLTVFYKMKRRGVKKINSSIMTRKLSEQGEVDEEGVDINKKSRTSSESWVENGIELDTVIHNTD